MGHSSPGERGAGRHTQHRSHGHHKHHSSSQKISGQLMVPMVSHRPHSSPGRVKPSTSGQQPQHRPTHVHHHSAQPVLQHANFTEPPVHPGFRYSKCTGRKKALCIGINYRGQPNELRGCINDAKNVKNFLVRASVNISACFHSACLLCEQVTLDTGRVTLLSLQTTLDRARGRFPLDRIF